MSYFLCGNTGNVNRGCEAIIRSTVKLLGQASGEIYLATFAPKQDRVMAGELGINMIPYNSYPSRVQRYKCGLLGRINKKSLAAAKYIAADLYSHMKRGDISFNIGGDTYCYDNRPIYSLALNKYAEKHGVNNIFWCCSVEKDVIKGEIKKDINRYKYIFAREQITFNNLIEQGIAPEKVIKVCDPAFFLDAKEVPLPNGFADGNTVGINVSECVLTENKENAVYDNVIHLIRYILNETDMSICLIPHVYSIEKNICDWPLLKRIREDVNSDRVGMVDKEYDCEQLKYIISKCRFMVCARTHASIAAYSSEVPTLVLGYSVKSKGIATDIFGTYKNFVVPYTELTTENRELTDAFKYIEQHETEIKERLHNYLPEYKEQLTDAIKKYVISNKALSEICDKMLCTGCGACASICPKKCINMVADKEGFTRPIIDKEACIDCGKCKKICPVTNRYRDDGKKPKICAAVNKIDAVRASSSSGGIFSALAEKIISNGGVVFGAVFDERFNVVHDYAQTVGEIEKFRGSKYVQGHVGNAYVKAKEFLDEGRTVLFTGLPCQIGGLYAYLRKDYENLITQDVICHGAPSPTMWKKYLAFREKNAEATAKQITFRDKRDSWKKYSLCFRFDNQSEYRVSVADDAYMKSFLLHYCLRPSCHSCAFKNLHRQSDITLADCWGIERVQPEKNDDKGVSLVMIHSSKGEALIEACGDCLTMWDYDLDKALEYNPSMIFSARTNFMRRNFMRDLNRLPMDKLTKKYFGVGITARAQRFLMKL